MLIVSGLIIGYIAAVFMFALPKINKSIQILEEKNGKEILNKVVTITRNVNADLEYFKKTALQMHKDELRHLTDSIWSIIQEKYNQTRPENVGMTLKTRANDLESIIHEILKRDQQKTPLNKLKMEIINFVRNYRYNNGIGYFWINTFEPRMVMHPVMQELDNQYLGKYQDPDGAYIFNKMVAVCKKQGSGIIKYKWPDKRIKMRKG